MTNSPWLLLLLALAGCTTTAANNAEPPKTLAIPDAEVFAKAKASITEDMIDPESTRVIELRRINYNSTDLVCGQVNSKNRMGGYTGKKPFAYSVERNRSAILGEAAGNFDLAGEAWVWACITNKRDQQ